MLRRDTDDHYWRRVLVYCAQHNLQPVLDEYARYLVDAEGLGARPAEERAIGVARAMAPALAIRPSQIDVDDVQINGKSLAISKFQMRGRFAMRLADYKDEDGAVARLGGVRDAFNSPFRPFVLATTSVGQEGLDFHPYCYRVYHWNRRVTRWTSNSGKAASIASRAMQCASTWPSASLLSSETVSRLLTIHGS
ncbi:MAG: hypothetical protein AB7G35_00735 [Hyphomicrobiaceae bacterium]